MVAVPRRKPSVVRRAMSWILPLKILMPPSTSSTASMGSRWARRAACTARPIPMALVVEPRIAHSLISLPVRGALQVEAMEPTSTQALRLMRSIHFQDAARATTTALSRTSASVSGYIWRSWMAKLVIWASGNARPMQSPSITGRSSIAARHEGLDGVAAADLERHHRAELPAEVLLHHGDGERHRLGVGEPLLAHQRRAHVGDDRHQVVVGELGGVHELARRSPGGRAGAC